MLSKEDQRKIEKAWSNTPKRLPRTRWWESPTILKYIAKRVCARVVEDGNWGLAKLQDLGRTFDNAISIGCGLASKEMALLQAGIVKHFYLYELSRERIEQGKKIAQELGLADRVSFFYGDFFKSPHNVPKAYDLVFWSGSLHHMFNTKFAILVSCDILKDDGYFYCDEYVGKNRFQYSDEEITIASEIRAGMPPKFFYVPNSDNVWLQKCFRPDLESLMASDISEAADSENIIPSIQKVFPHAEIIPLGGLVYVFVLSNILVNIPEESKFLNELMDLDFKLSEKGFNMHAFTLVSKHAP